MHVKTGKIHKSNKDFSSATNAIHNLFIFSPHSLGLGFVVWELF